MNWYNSITKLATVEYLYHGTSLALIPSILHSGLQFNPKKRVWDESSGARNTDLSLESYPGVYLTQSFSTARQSAANANHTFGKGQNKGSYGFVMVRMEMRSPHVVMDEDSMIRPERFFTAILKTRFEGLGLFRWVAGSNGDEPFWGIEEIAQNMLKSYFDDISKKTDEAATIQRNERWMKSILPLTIECIKKYAEWYVSVEAVLGGYENVIKYHYPQFMHLKPNDCEQVYRSIADTWLQKANRLTEEKHGYDRLNVRSKEAIGFSGKNRIVLVSSILPQWSQFKRWSPYEYKIMVHYVSDYSALNKLINEFQTVAAGLIAVNSHSGAVLFERKNPGTVLPPNFGTEET